MILRRKVVILAKDPITRSVLSVVLDSKMYRVVPLESLFSAPDYRLRAVIAVGMAPEICSTLETEIHRVAPWVQVVAVCRRGEMPEAIWMSDLLRRLKIACVMRTGPRPRCSTGNKAFHAEGKVA